MIGFHSPVLLYHTVVQMGRRSPKNETGVQKVTATEDGRQRTFYNRSLERALRILCAFNDSTQTLTLAQLSDSLDLSKSTLARLCTTLVDYDFLRYDEQTNEYSLGLKVFQLGGLVFSTFSLRNVASSCLARLQLRLGKTVFLGIMQDDEIVYIDKKENPRNPIQFASNVGDRRPPSFGMFQLLMAFVPEIEVNRILQRRPLTAETKKSIIDEKLFKVRLAAIRENGFLIEEGEAIDGVTGISAPIRDFGGKVVAAIGVSFITSSVDEKGKQAMTKEVINAARDISERLGMRPRARGTGAGAVRLEAT